ncbi:hypothetical protein [Neorhizobium sp. DAR64860/K0K1]|uniref:hypothetical protein n=1 Tax=Neorhizobium sp. DAR64860/K0K1 TaxID=3421955 RepID=UPI003D2D5284
MVDTPAKASPLGSSLQTAASSFDEGPLAMKVDQKAVSGMPIIASSTRSESAKVTPVPMLPSEIVRIETAMFFAQVSDKTIRTWAAKDGIGRQAERHAPLQISLPALLMKADGDHAALDALRAGRRSNPAVAAYLDRAIDLLEEVRLGGRR